MTALTEEQRICLAIWRKASLDPETFILRLPTKSTAETVKRTLYRVIKPYREGREYDPILTDALGGPVKIAAVRSELQAFAGDLGFKVVPHGLRKNAVNSLLEAGCTVHQVMAITGQSPQIVEKYARKVDQRTLGEAAILKMEVHKSREKQIQ